MSNSDLNQFRKVIREEVSQIVSERINTSEKRIIGVIDDKISASEKRLSGSIDKKISASEKRLTEKLTGVMDDKISASEKRLIKEISDSKSKVIGEIGVFLSEQILPLLDEKADKTDIDRLERKIDKVLDTGIDHENRIRAIENIPVIAHELRVGKAQK